MSATAASVQSVILAGGRGERLRPLTDHVPKPLVPVNGKPYLEWQIEDLVQHGLKRILILTGYKGEQIEAALGKGEKWNAEISYSHEKTPLGTGGALIQAEKYLDPFFILLNGDSFLRLNFEQMISSFHRRSVPMLVATYDNRIDTSVPNNLKIAREFVTEYQKGAGKQNGFDAVDAGVYIFDREILARLNSQTKHNTLQNLESLWTELIAEQKVGSFSVDERFYDIGTLDRLKEFENALNAHGGRS